MAKSKYKKRKKPYRIIGAYDSETTNINEHGKHYAFPMLHQLGLLDCEITEVDSENVEQHVSMHLFRHAIELYAKLDEICATDYAYVPVICCHNLAFDMYGLSSWLDSKDNVRVLAKSRRKPITFTIRDEKNNARLVIWDTLVFSGQPLDRMGADCGYAKATGKWDYDLIRTPETPLTKDETEYATKDIYALIAWLSWWLKRNPDIKPERLGLNVVTKTGVVRELRRVRFDQVRGNGSKYNIGRMWHFVNRTNMPATDDELYMMHACTRGGFTFCASRYAGVPFVCDGSKAVIAYDAVSQHPAQMCSHVFPVNFHAASKETLEFSFRRIGRVKREAVLKHFDKPFHVAFYACFRFKNLRMKPGSLFEKHGIAPFASARVVKDVDTDNEQSEDFKLQMQLYGYMDVTENGEYAFGKLVSADSATLFLTELAAWEMHQAYEWDSVEAIDGYISTRFIRPTDMAVISVMQFYKAKNVFKHARSAYFGIGHIDNETASSLLDVGVAPAFVEDMKAGTLKDSEIDSYYLLLKSNLNALFGIEACNEFRRDTVLTSNGIDYEGDFGIANAPKNPKAWYQFGQRIVGWSRIAQTIVMQECDKYADAIINGDTDSIKVLIDRNKVAKLEASLQAYSEAVDRAKKHICNRAKRLYPKLYDSLDNIGHYECEFETDRFCASWNKAYAMQEVDKRDNMRHFAFTLAGIPARRGINQCADYLYSKGLSYEKIVSLMLGYNVTYSYNVTYLNARAFPIWGDAFQSKVTDYKGKTTYVVEPAALALYPMAKTVNDTNSKENARNMQIASLNNPGINIERKIVARTKTGGFAIVKAGF